MAYSGAAVAGMGLLILALCVTPALAAGNIWSAAPCLGGVVFVALGLEHASRSRHLRFVLFSVGGLGLIAAASAAVEASPPG